MTLKNFYKILQDFVIYQKEQNKRYEWVHTFAVLPNMSSLNSENLGKNSDYKDTPYFWNRAWATGGYKSVDILKGYPALFAFEMSGTKSKKESTYSFELSFADILNESCKDCKGRVVEDIYCDIDDFISSFINYICDLVCIKVETKEGEKTYYCNRQVYECEPFGTVDEKCSKAINQMITQMNNLNSTGFEKVNWERSGDRAYGTSIFFNIKLKNCNKDKFEVSKPTVPITKLIDDCC